MVPYFALFLLPLAWAAVRAGAPKAEPAFAWGLGLVLGLVVGLRREVGGDWDSYVAMMERLGAAPWGELARSDILFAAVNLGARGLGAGMWLVDLACAAAFTCGLILLCRRQSSPPAALALAIPVLVLLVGMGSMRQSAAIGLLLVAHDLLLRGRRKGALAALLCAIGFHWSAAAFLPLAVLVALRKPLTLRASLIGGAAAAALSLAAYAAVPHVRALIDAANVAGGALIRTGLSLPALAVAVATARRSELLAGRADRNCAHYLSGVALLALAIVPVMSTVADRIAFYLAPYQIVFLPLAAELLPRPRLRAAALCLVVAPFVAMMVVWSARSSYARACWAPYRTYLDGRTPWFGPGASPYRAYDACDRLQGKSFPAAVRATAAA